MLKDFLKELNENMSVLEKESCINYWNAAISGDKNDYESYEKASIKYDKYFSDKDLFKKLKGYESELGNGDIEIKRQYSLFYNYFLWNQVDAVKLESIVKLSTKIKSLFSNFRANVNWKELSDNELDQLLKTSSDSVELKEAWLAHKKIWEVLEKDVLDLVKKRNDIAKDLGFDNYHIMHLTLWEQDPADVLSMFDDLDILTKDQFLKYKSDIDWYFTNYHDISKEQLKPWHYQDKFFQKAPNIVSTNFDKYFEGKDLVKITVKYFDSLWMDIKDIVNNSDLFGKEWKNQHAFCEDVDRNGDIRVLCNVVDNSYWMTTLLHEYGHAVYDKYFDFSKWFILRRSAHTFVTEAIAIFFQRFAIKWEWLDDVMGIKMTDNEKQDAKYIFSLDQLVFSRWSQVMFRFEKELYANPDQDLNNLWWDLVEKYQWIKYVNRETKADWASKIHIATAPCYYHNYLLWAVLSAQIHHYVNENILKLAEWTCSSLYWKVEVWDFLQKEIFFHWKLYKWDELIKKALGEKLTVKYCAKQFG